MKQKAILEKPSPKEKINLEKLLQTKREEIADTNLFKEELVASNVQHRIHRALDYLLVGREEELQRINIQKEILTEAELSIEHKEMQKITLSLYKQILITIRENEKSLSFDKQKTTIDKIITKIVQTTEEQRKDDRTYIAHIAEIYTKPNSKREKRKQFYLLREKHLATAKKEYRSITKDSSTTRKYLEPPTIEQPPTIKQQGKVRNNITTSDNKKYLRKKTLTERISREFEKREIVTKKEIGKKYGKSGVSLLDYLVKREFCKNIGNGQLISNTHREAWEYIEKETQDNPDPLAYQRVPNQPSFQQRTLGEQNKVKRIIEKIRPTLTATIYSAILQGKNNRKEIRQYLKEQRFSTPSNSLFGVIKHLKKKGLVEGDNGKYATTGKLFYVRAQERIRG